MKIKIEFFRLLQKCRNFSNFKLKKNLVIQFRKIKQKIRHISKIKNSFEFYEKF